MVGRWRVSFLPLLLLLLSVFKCALSSRSKVASFPLNQAMVENGFQHDLLSCV